MSTHGAVGFYKDGVTKVAYNNQDSYPTSLLFRFLSDVKFCSLKKLSNRFDKIKHDDDAEEFTGSFEKIRFREDFLADSLFCSWAYIANIDDEVVEIYRGGNKNPNALGRYANLGAPTSEYRDNDYLGVVLVAVIHFEDLYSSKSWINLGNACEYLQEASYKDLSIRGMTRRSEKFEKILKKGNK